MLVKLLLKQNTYNKILKELILNVDMLVGTYRSVLLLTLCAYKYLKSLLSLLLLLLLMLTYEVALKWILSCVQAGAV